MFADVQFEENAHGGASAIGTFVSSESKVRGFYCLVKGEGTFCEWVSLKRMHTMVPQLSKPLSLLRAR
jgi:hypothetical protein